MSAHAPTHVQTIHRSQPSPSHMVQRLSARFAEWKMRRHSRHELAMLDAHMLADIGVDPMTANDEAAKPFWRV